MITITYKCGLQAWLSECFAWALCIHSCFHLWVLYNIFYLLIRFTEQIAGQSNHSWFMFRANYKIGSYAEKREREREKQSFCWWRSSSRWKHSIHKVTELAHLCGAISRAAVNVRSGSVRFFHYSADWLSRHWILEDDYLLMKNAA